MERQSQIRKFQKKDLIFFFILILSAFALLFWYMKSFRQTGNQVEVTVDGAVYGTYSLEEEQEIPILSILSNGEHGEVTNRLVIAEGRADMVWADCPDKLCVKQHEISHTGETIVCLPNRVVVTVIGEDEAAFDAVVR